VLLQPELNVYVIFAVPITIPVTTPDVDPIVATPTLLLDHVPLPGVHESVEVKPGHIESAPEIDAGVASTVTVAVLTEPPVTA
jgi:hypothetical protein